MGRPINWKKLRSRHLKASIILTQIIYQKLKLWTFIFLNMEWQLNFPLVTPLIMICRCKATCIFFPCVSLFTCLWGMTSPAGWQDIVILNDGQIRSCYSALRQKGRKTVWQQSRMYSPVTLSSYKQWLSPSLKQSHYKLDMASVTLAIIRGQDSWPLLVMVHVVITSLIGRGTQMQKLFCNACPMNIHEPWSKLKNNLEN